MGGLGGSEEAGRCSRTWADTTANMEARRWSRAGCPAGWFRLALCVMAGGVRPMGRGVRVVPTGLPAPRAGGCRQKGEGHPLTPRGEAPQRRSDPCRLGAAPPPFTQGTLFTLIYGGGAGEACSTFRSVGRSQGQTLVNTPSAVRMVSCHVVGIRLQYFVFKNVAF